MIGRALPEIAGVRAPRPWWVLASLCTLALAGCAEEVVHAAETPTFEVTTVLREDTEIVQEYVCQIRASQHIEVRALESGYLRDVFVDEGQQVERGQRLFQITPVLYQAEVALASAEQAGAAIE